MIPMIPSFLPRFFANTYSHFRLLTRAPLCHGHFWSSSPTVPFRSSFMAMSCFKPTGTPLQKPFVSRSIQTVEPLWSPKPDYHKKLTDNIEEIKKALLANIGTMKAAYQSVNELEDEIAKLSQTIMDTKNTKENKTDYKILYSPSHIHAAYTAEKLIDPTEDFVINRLRIIKDEIHSFYHTSSILFPKINNLKEAVKKLREQVGIYTTTTPSFQEIHQNAILHCRSVAPRVLIQQLLTTWFSNKKQLGEWSIFKEVKQLSILSTTQKDQADQLVTKLGNQENTVRELSSRL